MARRYRDGVQVITVRLSSGEVVRSLQSAHFPLAARVRVQVRTTAPVIFFTRGLAWLDLRLQGGIYCGRDGQKNFSRR